MPKVEFIEEYIKTESDYKWNDNHGELIRCKECKHLEKSRINYNECVCYWGGYVKQEDDFCSWARRRRMKTKYDIGNMVYIPFQIYRIEVSEERTLYIARGYGEEWKHLTVSLTEEEVDMYSIRGNDENQIQG